MFYRAYLCISLGDGGAALGGDDIFGHRIDHGFSFKIYTLDFVTGILGCGVESSLDDCSCVKTFTADAERLFKCYLLHMVGLI